MVAQTRFNIQGMDCGACARKIDTVVRRMPGVKDVNVSVASHAMTVVHESGAELNEAIPQKLKSLGYGASPVLAGAGTMSPRKPEPDGHDDHEGHDHAEHDHDHHDHEGHDHEGHDHKGHDHEGHDHEGHNHEGHDHGALRPETKAKADLHAGHDHPAGSAHAHVHESHDGPWWSSGKGKLTIAVGLAAGAAWALSHFLPAYGQWAFIAAVLVGLIPIAKRAFMAAINGVPFTIESLMTVAAVGAIFIGATEEAASVILLFLIGEMLEGAAAGKARQSIKALTSLLPSTAMLRDGEHFREVPSNSLQIDQTIMIPPGDRISADGIIVSGEGNINEASVTGESLPVFKQQDAAVFAGTVNGEATLLVRVTAQAADNTIARVVRLVEEAQESKAPMERFIDRFSTYYTPAVFLTGLLVCVVPPLLFGAAWNVWIYKGLAILLIGCPCALVISTPAAIAASLSTGARRGLLIKGGAALEGLAKITTAAIDKTGTLTQGKPVITDIIAVKGTERDVLAMAASLEVGSTHPLAKAIIGRAEADKLTVVAAENIVAVGGKGVVGQTSGRSLFLASVPAAKEKTTLDTEVLKRIEALNADGKSVSVLLANATVMGVIAMRDEARADVKSGLQALRDLGVSIIMLTGDNRRTAEAAGKDLGIDVRSELLPEHKLQIIRDLQKAGEKVVKVGDGINDAPALAAADIGIAMGGGTDVALETADAAILHGRVGDIAAMIHLAKATMANIWQNISIALGLKVVFLITTILGLTGLWPAILADTGATVLVTANALRLLKQK